MSFTDFELSNYDSIPLTFYEFRLGDTIWRYTNCPADITIGVNTYTAIAISDDGLKQTGEVDSDELKITLPSDATFNTMFIGTPPSEEILVTIKRRNFGSTDLVVVWVGTVKSNKRLPARTTREISCKMLIASLNRPGLRLSWGRNCPHALYDQSCRVDPDDYATVVTVSNVIGNQIFSTGIDALADHYLTGGYLEFVRAGIDAVERRAIDSHVGNKITVLGLADGILIGDSITVYPGCNRTIAECDAKFDNVPNYGGFPHLPGKSPFDGGPVF
jgi:uncharacterized phage protein (TIGR02218 family)